jgi:hypothetical protein
MTLLSSGHNGTQPSVDVLLREPLESFPSSTDARQPSTDARADPLKPLRADAVLPVQTPLSASADAADDAISLPAAGAGRPVWQLLLVGSLVVVLSLYGVTWWSGRAESPAAPARAPAPTVVPTTAAPPVPTIAYWSAPEGLAGALVMGQVGRDADITARARYGDDWVQVELPFVAMPVWVLRRDLPRAVAELADTKPDLLPTPTPIPAPTAVPVPVEAPAAAPAPAECTQDRVVAIVRRGATVVASCESLVDALTELPGGTIEAQGIDQVQAYYARVSEGATAITAAQQTAEAKP